MKSSIEWTAEIVNLLSEIYTPKGIEIWLTHPHRLLNGERAIDVIRKGQPERVLQIVNQLIDGAYV